MDEVIRVSSVKGRAISWASEVRYLGVFVVRSRSFKWAYNNAKRSFYSAVNGIFGNVLNFACPVNKTDLRSLDFTVDRVFMKLFKTGNIEIVRECQAFFF